MSTERISSGPSLLASLELAGGFYARLEASNSHGCCFAAEEAAAGALSGIHVVMSCLGASWGGLTKERDHAVPS